jgi:3-hydroxyisobutyrate dehydrogenase
VVGYDVSDAAMQTFTGFGGEAAASPREVAEKTSIMISSLPNAAALKAAMGGNDGVATARGEGQIVIECSTLPLDVKQEAADAVSKRGKTLLDCPVSGTGAQAARKDLVVFASGDKGAIDRCQAVFNGMSRLQKFVGEFGNGSRMKYIANHLVTIHNVAAAEAIVLGIKGGLDPQLVYDVISDSAGTSRMFQVRGPMMVADRYDEATATHKMHVKDIDVISGFAAKVECPLPVFASAAQFYFAAMSAGRSAEDTASVCAVLEDMAGVKRGAKKA